MCISSVTRVFAALLLATAVACGGEEIASPPGEPAPAAAQLVVELVQPDPTGRADFTIDFGSLDLGKQGAAAFVLRNVGGAAVEIAPVQLEAPFSIRLDGEREIQAGGALSVVIRFTPTAPGTFESIMLLQAGEQTFAVRLRGSALSGPEPVCVLAVDERPMHWNDTGVDYPHEQTITLTNLGDGHCDVELGLEGEAFELQRASVRVAARSVKRPIVTFRPAEIGSVSDALRITSGDAAWTIELSGAAVARCLELESAALDFGTVGPGCETAEREVAMTNTCAHSVSVTDETMGTGTSSDFGVRVRPVLPAELRTGERTRFTVVYVPGDTGVDTGTFVVHQANGATVEVSLTGIGASTTRQIDRFSQGVIPRSDLLVVLDDSPGMEPYLDDLAAWGASMRDLFVAEGRDARWGVTTTSRLATEGCAGSGADGRLLPLTAPRWLTTEASAEAWGAAVDVGICSGAPNEGIAAAWRALSELASVPDDPAHLELDDGNAGFLRPNARLSVVFVSSRDDASGEDLDTWYERFASIKGENDFNAAAIAAPAGGCAAAAHGSRYLDLAQRTSGVTASICAPETWPGMDRRIGSDGFGNGLKTRFHLLNQPGDGDLDGAVEDEIVVRIDGAEIPPASAGGGWTYTPSANAIDFAEGHVPAEGAEFEVEYSVDCLPPHLQPQ